MPSSKVSVADAIYLTGDGAKADWLASPDVQQLIVFLTSLESVSF